MNEGGALKGRGAQGKLLLSPLSPGLNPKVSVCCRCQGAVICSQCRDGLQPSPDGDTCDPVASNVPDWLIPLVVVAVVVLSAVIVFVLGLLVFRCRRRSTSSKPRPPLPRPDELDDRPTDDRRTRKRRSFFSPDRRYTPTPRSQRTTEQVRTRAGFSWWEAWGQLVGGQCSVLHN